MTWTDVMTGAGAITAAVLTAVPLASLLAGSWRELGWKRRRELRDELRTLLDHTGPDRETNPHLVGPRRDLVRDAADFLDLDLADAALRVSRRRAKRYTRDITSRVRGLRVGWAFPVLCALLAVVAPFTGENWWLKGIGVVYFAFAALASGSMLRTAREELTLIRVNTVEMERLSDTLTKSKSLFHTSDGQGAGHCDSKSPNSPLI